MDMTNGLNQGAETTLATSLCHCSVTQWQVQRMCCHLQLSWGNAMLVLQLWKVCSSLCHHPAPHSHSKSSGWTQSPHAPDGWDGQEKPTKQCPQVTPGASHCTLRVSCWRRPQWYTLLWGFQTTFLHHQKIRSTSKFSLIDQTTTRYCTHITLSSTACSPGQITPLWAPTNPMTILCFTTDTSHPKTWTCWNIQSCSGTHAKKKSPWQQRRQLANGSCCTHTQN